MVSINGEIIEVDVPDDNEPLVIEHEGVLVVVVNSDLAMRAWPVDDRILFGTDFVGEMSDDGEYAVSAAKTGTYAIFHLNDGTF